jgi:predicted RNA-binding Zn-ribbon protein involved in translation (DUF1610 family)
MPRAVPNESSRALLHFHVCVHCGSAFRREQFEGRAITSGVFPCAKCGTEGPLNIEIREMSRPSADAGSLEIK